MTWQDDCSSPISRYRASRDDDDLNDAEFCVEGVKMAANRTILAMASPVLKTQFYGSLAVKMGVTIPIDDGTKRGFKAMLEFIYNEGEYSTKDLLGGKNDITEWEDLEKVLELLYFAHKYQINSLVSFGRGLLLQRIRINDTTVMKIHREIVSYKTILSSEFGIVNYFTNEFIGNDFDTIFKKVSSGSTSGKSSFSRMSKTANRRDIAELHEDEFFGNDFDTIFKKVSSGSTNMGKCSFSRMSKTANRRETAELHEAQVTADVFLPEDLMMELLKRKSLQVGEGFVLQVALAYARFCQDKELAKRMIPEVIDFTKLTLDEVDLSQVSTMLPDDIIFKMQTAMIANYKRGMEASVVREENPADYTISLIKMPLKQLPARKTSQIKFKVNKSCFILFKGPGGNHNYYGEAGNHNYYDEAGYLHSCMQIVWKQNGTLKQVVEGQRVNGQKFFADPDTEITVDFEMHSSIDTYELENVNGKFEKGDIELTVLEVNGESFSKKAGGKGVKKRKPNEDATIKEGLHVVGVTILPTSI